MADEKDVFIRITSKNLTAEGFAKVSASLKSLKGEASSITGAFSSYSAHLKETTRLSEQFAGSGQIQRAQQYASAVQQIGGASKLTANEQAQVNRAVTEAIEKYRALGQQAPKALQDLAEATKRVEAPTTLAGRAAGLLSGAFGQFTAANLAATAITTVTSKIGEFVAKGQQLRSVEGSFQRLALGAKQNSAEMLAAMESGTRGMVSNIDLMLAANKSMLLNLPATAKEMGELAEIAVTLGRAMGKDAASSLNEFVEAVGKGSPEILNNFGLVVRAEDAYQRYADQLGKTKDQLTAADRQMAVYSQAMEKARDKTRELGGATKTFVEILNTVAVKSGNQVTKAASFYDVALGQIFTSLKNLDKFSHDVSMFGLARALQIAEAEGRKLAATNQQAAKAAEQAAIANVNYVKTLADSKRGTAELTAEGRRQFLAAVELGVSTDELRERFGLTAQQIDRLKEAHQSGAEKARDHGAALGSLIDRIKGSDVTREMQLWAEAFRRPGMAAKVLADADLRGELRSALDTVEAKFGTLGAAGIGSLSGIHAALKAMVATATTIPPHLAQTLSAATLAQAAAGPQMIQVGLKPALSAETITEIVKQFTPKPAAMFGPQFGQSLATSMLHAIQGAGNIFAAAGGTIGTTLMGGLSTKLTTSAKDGVAPLLTGWIGGAVSAALPGIGALMGPLVGKMTEKLKEAFGGPSKGELEGRGVVSAFEQQLHGTLSAAEKLAAGNEPWKLTTIAVRNAYVAAGKSAAEAEAAVAKLWASSKGGANAARLAVLQIQAVMEAVTEKQGEMTAEQTERTAAQQREVDALKATLGDLDAEYSRLYNTIANEAPEEEMGVIERQARAQLEVIDEQRKAVRQQLEDATAAMAEGFDKVVESVDALTESLGGLTRQPWYIDVRTRRTDGFDPATSLPSHGSGAYIRRDHVAMVHGGEIVGPMGFMREALRGALADVGGGAGGPIVIHQTIKLDGREITRSVLRYQRDELGKYGVH